MKTLTLILAFLFCGSFMSHKNELVKKFSIGKFSYTIYKESKYLHDDNWNAEFFEVYRAGTPKRLCSSYLTAKRNDSTFVKGRYSIYKNRIEFTQCYFYNKNDSQCIDSIKTTFYPKKDGDLLLREAIEFTNGKSKIITKN